ncbi:hypothetical protein WMF04_29030 [Sorangium sp. So ce260]|uniref:hypothetical protein n=1 Tax=Sorangium sp. So ce260 TaxID=3133291 RepID=UPI003F61F490
MFRVSQLALAAAILLVGSEAMAWSTATISGTSGAGVTAQDYTWKDWGGGTWDKRHSVAYWDSASNAVKVARRDASSGFPAWSSWVTETVDSSLTGIDGISVALGKEDDAEFVAYVDDTTHSLKVARRVGGTAGNCGFLSQWSCETVVAADVVNSPSIAVRFDSVLDDYVVHVVYTFEPNSKETRLGYARKAGAAPWSTAVIKANAGFIRLASDAIALDGSAPFVAYDEDFVGVQVSQFLGPAVSNWVTTLVDANGGASASMDIKSNRREIAYTSGTASSIALKHAWWSALTGSWTVSTVDTALGDWDASLVIDDALNTHIGYRKSNAPWRAKQVSGVWSTAGTVTPFAAGLRPTVQVDTQLSPDKTILVHSNSFGVIQITSE